MYAVFQTGGKQFRAEPGLRLRIPSLDVAPGDSVTFDQVLLAGDGEEKIVVGTPTVDGASVKAEVVRHGRGDKIIVFKRKRRKGYRKKQGHRQNFTEIRIDEVALA
jgi:large subunit ribosomal protein L21